MKFFLCKQEMTLGIMQVSTTKYIDDRTSIELAMGIVKEAYEKYVKKEKKITVRDMFSEVQVKKNFV